MVKTKDYIINAAAGIGMLTAVGAIGAGVYGGVNSNRNSSTLTEHGSLIRDNSVAIAGLDGRVTALEDRRCQSQQGVCYEGVAPQSPPEVQPVVVADPAPQSPRRTQTPEVQEDLESRLYTPQECSVAEMRGLQDTLNFYNQSGERVGTITQINWENNTPYSFGDRVIGDLRSNILDPTGIYNAVSLTFENPNGNNFRVSYSPRNTQELVDFLNEKVRGDCTSGEYTVTIEGMTNVSPQIQRRATAASSQTRRAPATTATTATTRPAQQGCIPAQGLSVGGVTLPGQGGRECN